MLSIEQCREHLKASNLSDQQIAETRDLLSVFVEQALDTLADTEVLARYRKLWPNEGLAPKTTKMMVLS